MLTFVSHGNDNYESINEFTSKLPCGYTCLKFPRLNYWSSRTLKATNAKRGDL